MSIRRSFEIHKREAMEEELRDGEGKEPVADDIPSFAVTLEVYGPVILLAFLFVGAIFYTILEDWSFTDAFYFCAVSLATVGYGDLTPDTTTMKIFTILYIYIGIAFVASALGQLVGRTVSYRFAKNRDGFSEDVEGSVPRKPFFTRNQWECILSWLIIVLLGALGTVVYAMNEGMSSVDAVYFSMITLASVGYGDIDITKNSTKIFDIFYILLGVPLMGMAVLKFAEVWARIERQRSIDRFVKQGVTLEVIEAMDDDKSGEVERAEFLAYMLVHMGKVQVSDIHQINQLFNKLDIDGGGTLDINDLKTQVSDVAMV